MIVISTICLSKVGVKNNISNFYNLKLKSCLISDLSPKAHYCVKIHCVLRCCTKSRQDSACSIT